MWRWERSIIFFDSNYPGPAAFQRKSTTIFNNVKNFLIKTTDNLPWVMRMRVFVILRQLSVLLQNQFGQCLLNRIQCNSHTTNLRSDFSMAEALFHPSCCPFFRPYERTITLSYNLLDRIIYYNVIYIYIRDYHPHVIKAYQERRNRARLIGSGCVYVCVLNVNVQHLVVCHYFRRCVDSWFRY